MVKIRLRRKGKMHYPFYDIVAVDGRKKRDGAFIERLGYYNPNTTPSTISVDHERAIYWLNVGAQPTDMVRKLLSYNGVLLHRQLQFKNKSEQEIEEILAKHKENAVKRFHRRTDLRKKRIEAKEKAKKEAEKAEKSE